MVEIKSYAEILMLTEDSPLEVPEGRVIFEQGRHHHGDPHDHRAAVGTGALVGRENLGRDLTAEARFERADLSPAPGSEKTGDLVRPQPSAVCDWHGAPPDSD